MFSTKPQSHPSQLAHLQTQLQSDLTGLTVNAAPNRTQQLIENMLKKIEHQLTSIHFDNDARQLEEFNNGLFDLKHKNMILQNLRAWINQQNLAKKSYDLFEKLIVINNTLAQLSEMTIDTTQPFANLLTPHEKWQAETRDMLMQYDNMYRHHFLRQHGALIQTALTTKNVDLGTIQLPLIIQTLKNVKNMHAEPLKYLDLPYIHKAKPRPNSRLKYILLAASILLGLAIVAATVISAPIMAPAAMMVLKSFMAASGLCGVIKTGYDAFINLRSKSRNKHFEKTLAPFTQEVHYVNAFFKTRKSIPSPQPIALSPLYYRYSKNPPPIAA
jgi:hypothetical protein